MSVRECKSSGRLTQETVDLTVERAEHPYTTIETVVGEEGNIGGQHDKVRKSEIHHEDVGGSPKSLEGREAWKE